MTETTIRTRTGIAARTSVWVRRCLRKLSARIHAAGDDRARRYGWNVTETTGRFGFEARSYRIPASTTDAGNSPRKQAPSAPAVRQGR